MSKLTYVSISILLMSFGFGSASIPNVLAQEVAEPACADQGVSGVWVEADCTFVCFPYQNSQVPASISVTIQGSFVGSWGGGAICDWHGGPTCMGVVGCSDTETFIEYGTWVKGECQAFGGTGFFPMVSVAVVCSNGAGPSAESGEMVVNPFNNGWKVPEIGESRCIVEDSCNLVEPYSSGIEILQGQASGYTCGDKDCQPSLVACIPGNNEITTCKLGTTL